MNKTQVIVRCGCGGSAQINTAMCEVDPAASKAFATTIFRCYDAFCEAQCRGLGAARPYVVINGHKFSLHHEGSCTEINCTDNQEAE